MLSRPAFIIVQCAPSCGAQMESHVQIDTIAHINTVIGGYCDMLTMKTEEGYAPYILSLMYKPLRGPRDWVLGEIESGITDCTKIGGDVL